MDSFFEISYPFSTLDDFVETLKSFYFSTNREHLRTTTCVMTFGGLYFILMSTAQAKHTKDDERTRLLHYVSICQQNFEMCLDNLNTLLPCTDESFNALSFGVSADFVFIMMYRSSNCRRHTQSGCHGLPLLGLSLPRLRVWPKALHTTDKRQIPTTPISRREEAMRFGVSISWRRVCAYGSAELRTCRTMIYHFPEIRCPRLVIPWSVKLGQK